MAERKNSEPENSEQERAKKGERKDVYTTNIEGKHSEK